MSKMRQIAESDLEKHKYDVISTCGIFHRGKPYIYVSGSVRDNKWDKNFFFVHANNVLSLKIAS